VRYGRRGYEFQLLGRELKQRGLAGLPADITELYVKADALGLQLQGLYTISNWFALREMRRKGASAAG
jgi:hypothetical protein